jgi:hypothetical protein
LSRLNQLDWYRLDRGERLAALTLLAVFLFNVYQFINVG